MGSYFAIEREKNNHIFYREYSNDYCLPHFHSQIELYFVTEGEMEITINNYRKNIKKGELAVSLSYDTHEYKTLGYSASKVFIIPIHFASDFENLIEHKRAHEPFISDYKTIEAVERFINTIRTASLSELELRGYIYLILGAIYKQLSFKTIEESITYDLSNKILLYLNENYKEPISLQLLAHHLGYNIHYISRYFKSCFSISFNSYLNLLRLRNAVKLIDAGCHNITYCAMESGFNSMRTFYRVFKNEFNMTPKEYIKKQVKSGI